MHRMRERRHAQAGKSLVPMLGVLAGLAVLVAVVAIVLQIQERGKRQAKEQELHLALAENEDLKGRLQSTEQAKSRIEQELESAREEFTEMNEDLAASLIAQETLARSVEDRENEIARLAKELKQAQSETAQSSDRFSELQADRVEMERQLADLNQAKADLESKVMELSGQPTVQLDKVFVAGDQGGEGGMVLPVSRGSGIASSGQVVVVNREYDFIVMNLGKSHGLVVGQEFQIVRGEDVLGRVKVEKVYDELSAAAILPESNKGAIREGDLVEAQ